MLRFLTICLLAIGVAFAPLGSIAHAKGHASANVSLKVDEHAASHKVQNIGHDHHSSSKPCDTKSHSGGTDCCTLGCQLILAETAPFIVGCETQKLARVTVNAVQHSGTNPASFDPPPRA
jgi:hypothetical protein